MQIPAIAGTDPAETELKAFGGATVSRGVEDQAEAFDARSPKVLSRRCSKKRSIEAERSHCHINATQHIDDDDDNVDGKEEHST